jgi:hypothetical protein
MSRELFRLVGVWSGCWVVRTHHPANTEYGPRGLKHVGAKNTKTKKYKL